jgi:hypothetical protein
VLVVVALMVALAAPRAFAEVVLLLVALLVPLEPVVLQVVPRRSCCFLLAASSF